MKHALIAASLVLVAGTTFGCGGNSDDDKAASETTSTADFCTAYKSLFSSFEGATKPPSDAEAVKAIKDWGDEMEKTGTPEDIPADAKEGFQLVLDTIADIPDDATKAEIQKLTGDLSAEEQKQSDAFGKWASETCPQETPSSTPSQ
jgi:hypothetical protein